MVLKWVHEVDEGRNIARLFKYLSEGVQAVEWHHINSVQP